MRRDSIDTRVFALRMLLVAAALLTAVATARAQDAGSSKWRVGAAAGGYVPFSSLIKAADASDTRLSAGPGFALDVQYQARSAAAVYANGSGAFGRLTLGSSIRPSVLGPSDQVMLLGGTAGVLLSANDWLGENIQPTLRLGGGFKYYAFDLAGAENQLRPTGDIGLGIRGVSISALEVNAEVRYLPSAFDQAKLPIRGIAAQEQRQNDLIFSVGFGIRSRTTRPAGN